MLNAIRQDGAFQQMPSSQQQPQLPGGRFDFDDGGFYCGGWEDGKAIGHGICTGPRGQGEYAGSWHTGFELSGCYTWPSGNTFSGQWQNGKRHGLGVETRGRWIYRGEWNQGLKGRYGVRASLTSGAKYEGTFSSGLQDGYGTETYADGGTFQGQWLRGLRHGYGIRSSAVFAAASIQRKKSIHAQTSVELAENAESVAVEEDMGDPAAERDQKIDANRGGFVLKAHSEEPTVEKKRKTFAERKEHMKNSLTNVLRLPLKKQRSTGDIDQKTGNHVSAGSLRSARSNSSFGSSGNDSAGMASAASETNISFISQEEILDPNVTESYTGEWKNDKRSGFGVAERSDGLKYEGEWHNNRKYGYGVTSFKDRTKEEGKYRNNVLISSQKKKATFLVRSKTIRDKIDQAVSAAQRASQIALQKADIAMNRTATARGKAEQAEIAAMNAKEDAEIARAYASQFAPEYRMGGRSNQPTQLINAFSTVDHESMIQQRVNSLYGRPRQSDYPDIRVQTNYVEEEPFMPAGVAARIGGRLTVDDSLVQESSGSRRTSIHHFGDDGLLHTEDFAPEQFLNRASPRNLSVRGSLRSRRSTKTGEDVNNARQNNPHNRPTEQGTTSVMMASMIDPQMGDHSMNAPPYSTQRQNHNPYPQQRGPQPQHQTQQQQQQTQQHSPYYAATPNPATLTPLSYQIGTPEYMQQVAEKLQQNHRPMIHQNSLMADPQAYHLYRPAPAPKDPITRRSTLPVIVDPTVLTSTTTSTTSKSHRTPVQKQLSAIQEGSGSIGGSIHSNKALLSTDPSGRLSKQPSVDVQPSSNSQMSMGGSKQALAVPIALQPMRKTPKFGSVNMGSSRGSMPDIFQALSAEAPLSREEVSRLSSERREAVRRKKEEEERMRRNPLLFIFHPALRDFFSRHQLTLLVAMINLTLIYLFMDLLYGS